MIEISFLCSISISSFANEATPALAADEAVVRSRQRLAGLELRRQIQVWIRYGAAHHMPTASNASLLASVSSTCRRVIVVRVDTGSTSSGFSIWVAMFSIVAHMMVVTTTAGTVIQPM